MDFNSRRRLLYSDLIDSKLPVKRIVFVIVDPGCFIAQDDTSVGGIAATQAVAVLWLCTAG